MSLALTLIVLAVVTAAVPWWFHRRNVEADRRIGLRDADLHEAEALSLAWERAARGAGLVRVAVGVAGSSEIASEVVHVALSRPPRLTVRLEPGMTVDSVRAAAPQIAPHLGAWGLRVAPVGTSAFCTVTLLWSDPLDSGPIPLETRPDRLILGRDEQGHDVAVTLDELGHVAVQGQTGSGKSTALYGVLVQLRERAEITGIDPSGVLLRPFPGCVLGLADLSAVEAFLVATVAEMDERISRIPADADVLVDAPRRVIVLEEYPGLLRALDAADTKLGKRCRSLIGRLLAESRKAGFHVILVAQRAEAVVLGGSERAQCSTRISFRCDDPRLLHPEVDPATAAEHATAPAGVGLVSLPGRSLTRFRAPYLPYAEYAQRVTGGAA